MAAEHRAESKQARWGCLRGTLREGGLGLRWTACWAFCNGAAGMLGQLLPGEASLRHDGTVQAWLFPESSPSVGSPTFWSCPSSSAPSLQQLPNCLLSVPNSFPTSRLLQQFVFSVTCHSLYCSVSGLLTSIMWCIWEEALIFTLFSFLSFFFLVMSMRIRVSNLCLSEMILQSIPLMHILIWKPFQVS